MSNVFTIGVDHGYAAMLSIRKIKLKGLCRNIRKKVWQEPVHTSSSYSNSIVTALHI